MSIRKGIIKNLKTTGPNQINDNYYGIVSSNKDELNQWLGEQVANVAEKMAAEMKTPGGGGDLSTYVKCLENLILGETQGTDVGQGGYGRRRKRSRRRR